MRNRQQQQQRFLQIARFEGRLVTNGFPRESEIRTVPILRVAQGLVIDAELISYLTHYIAQHVKNPADVDGRVQDTLLEAFQAYSHYKGNSALKTWLIGIAKHQIAHYYRQAANATEHLGYEAIIETNNDVYDNEEYRATRNEELLEGFLSLSKKHQQILYWHAMGLSGAEIGKKLRISEDAVNQRIARARAALKNLSKKK